MRVVVILVCIVLLFSITGCSQHRDIEQPVTQEPVKEGVAKVSPGKENLEESPIENVEEQFIEEVIEETPDVEAQMRDQELLDDSCTGSPADDDIVCIDGDSDGQISREAIETIGEITDSRKSKFFDNNRFFLETDEGKFKITVLEVSDLDGDFRLDSIPEEDVGLCGLQVEFKDGIYTVKFNPGSSHKGWDDVQHCLDQCDVKQEASEQPSFDQQSCLLECGIEVCQS